MAKVSKNSSAEKRSAHQEQLIYERIFDVILDQKLAPGARLTEEALGEIFGVSRTIIRRVLLRLSHEGVVEIKPNRGASVTSTPVSDVDQYFEARRVIEGAIIRMAAGRASDYEINDLRSLIGEEKRYYESQTRGKGLRTSNEVHFRIAALAGNEPLADVARQLISRTALIISQYQDASQSACAYCDHTALVDALEAGDPDKAEHLMVEHIDHIRHTLHLSEESAPIDLFDIFSDDGEA
ncbi:MAG TPA: GntR family transcriptional regulator [Gammaproteobacteria bacterium]|jgi:DNA-binding GntR family transcriptional regulator|nr:GntR family transcriptional regulator [Gammaproteobacteria bacterium]